ncbi:alpha/beta fold hydrolase [Actinokineospora auranticolor]|uniref:Pimeloyl-ACP methyl ester carboxylesterase n=1 Tax=Actinokineospora auranticolor TaxID=155976 RepID=A0A2S6GZ57_9PSEU|nr:alpha/beta fold hydrolase [Actinokineospora auranticolor]PPK70447.1 pimeloyl-ACP methyl ester carboxylesterase [Actinokineospora auranticolor]
MLLYVHGHPFDRTMWAPQLTRFGGTAPDLRGYGDGPAASGVTPMSTFAADLAEVAGPDPVVLCGLSMGGQIAMEFHRLYPSRVRALILADTSARAETPETKGERLAMADRLSREGMAPYAAEALWKMVAPGNDEAAEHVRRMMLAAPPDGAAAAQRGRAERPDYRESLLANPVPTLVVVGSEDSYTPVAEAELIPSTSLVVIEGAAHLPNLERQTAFNAAVGDFLAGL